MQVFSKGYKEETDQGSDIWSCDCSDYEEHCFVRCEAIQSGRYLSD